VKNKERVETLMELGLTFDQARIYLTLLQAGPATAKEIAEISKIARPDIYRIIPTLQQEGAVEKHMTKPASFQAIPLAFVLPTMLKRKTAEQNKLKKKTEEMLGDFKNTQAKVLQEADTEFTIIPRKEAIIQRLKEALLKSQISVCVVTSQKRFSVSILEFEKIYRKILEKGAKIRIATERYVPEKKALKTIQKLMEDSNFEVKYFDEAPTAIVSIFDNKEASVTLSATASLAGASAIWSNNPCFIALTQNYFEKKWNQASYSYNIILERSTLES
jgi:sugar-specific transcriptional regulator TrmB